MSEVARRWIAANFFVMVASVVAAMTSFGIRGALDLDGADAPSSAKTAFIIADTMLTLATFVIYAKLTGEVLRMIVPTFPWRSWLAIHVLMGLVAGVVFGFAGAFPGDGERMDWTDAGTVMFMLALMTLGGAVLGAVIGGLQALILRRAAYGSGVWIAVSALATALMLFMIAVAFPFAPSESTFAAEAARQGLGLIAGVVSSVVMLPALRRLRPRTAEG